MMNIGDKVDTSLVNRYERPVNHLPNPSEVVAVTRAKMCQSGEMVKVKTHRGVSAWMDIAWFKLIDPEMKCPNCGCKDVHRIDEEFARCEKCSTRTDLYEAQKAASAKEWLAPEFMPGDVR
jgi:hypothetical protein